MAEQSRCGLHRAWRRRCAWDLRFAGPVRLSVSDSTTATMRQKPRRNRRRSRCSFFKATTSLVGPNDPLMMPKNSSKVDWEVELAVVIGKRALYTPKEKALDYVAGYVLHNDYSERSFQLEHGGQWVKGKSADTFAPLGPFLATPDEVPQNRQCSHVA